MTPSPDDLDPLTGLPPVVPGDPQQQEQQRTTVDAAGAVGDLAAAGAIEATGEILGAAADAGGAVADAAGSALGAAADGCSGCSCAIIIALGLALSAGTAVAAQLFR